MAIEPGTYVLVSGKNSNYALDVKNGSEKNGSACQLYTRNDTDAQLLRVIPVDNCYRLQFILNGKCLDRASNGTTNGTAVQVYDVNGTAAQKWRIVDSGSTGSISGTSYVKYILKHPTLDMALDVASGTMANGTKLQLYEANNTDAQNWMLVPQNPVANGTYEMVTALSSTMRVDVKSGSTAQGANVQLYSRNDTNAQKWVVSTDSNGISTIKSAETGYALDVQSGSTKDGANVQVYAANGTEAQQWVIEPSSTSGERNGQPSAYYRVHVVSGKGRVLDVASGKTALNTNIQVYSANGTKAQLFEFVPTESLADDLPVPSSLGISKASLGASSGTAATFAYGSVAVYPRFACSGSTYQMRYRTRTRTAKQDNSDRSSWSAWASIADGSTSNSGWGDIQDYNCEVAQKGGVNWAKALTGTLSSGGTDLVEWQYEVRRFAETWGKANGCAHGNSATATVKAAVKPNVSGISAAMTTEGIAVTYTSDFIRSGNTVTVSAPGLFSAAKSTAMPYSGTVVVPYGNLTTVPDEGDTYAVTVQVTTCDGGIGSTTSRTAVSYDAQHGTTVTAKATVDGTLATIKTDATAVYLRIERGHGDRLVECPVSNGSVTIAPPLGVPYLVFVMKGSTSGAWASTALKMDAVNDGCYHITATDCSSDLRVKVKEGERPDFSVSYERDMSLNSTTGREREVVGLGTTVSASWNLGGTLVDKMDGAALDALDSQFDTAAHMGKCIFRSPHGFWAQAAIKSASIDFQRPDYHDVDFSFEEVQI